MKAYICGTACLFKSSIVSILRDRGYSAKVGDFKEACDEFPFLRGKGQGDEDGIILGNIYNAYTLLSEIDGAVHDRSVLDGIIYDCMFRKIDMPVFTRHISNFKRMNERWLMENYFMFLLSGDDEGTLERMLRRNNGIDIMTLDYVEQQNRYFGAAARILEKDVMYVHGPDDILKIVSKIVSNFPLEITLISGPIKSNYLSDAGIDLYNAENKVLLPGELTLVKVYNRVLIANGFYGRLVSRSSTEFLVYEGVIDAGYKGDLFYKCVNISSAPVSIFKDRSYVQLILTPFTKKYSVVDESIITRSDTLRGFNGFGSTSKQ